MYQSRNNAHCLEIFAPYLRNLQFFGHCPEIRLKNVASLVTAVLRLEFCFGDREGDMQKELTCLKKLLSGVAHVENLELGPWCIECLSILELKGWQSPTSSRKLLNLNAAVEQLDYVGICNFLQSSSDLETLVIDWLDEEPRSLLSRYTDEDEQKRRFETYKCNNSLLHLKTIKFINVNGSPTIIDDSLRLVKYFLKNATVLEKFIFDARFGWSIVSPNYVKIAEEVLRFPRSSPHASVVLSNR